MKKSNTPNPLISVITVTYNAEKIIETCINSVINQTFQNYEFIIIDGKSSDATVSIVHKYSPSIDFWLSEEDQGIYDAMNKGVKVAKGEWLYFLGADDQLYDTNVLENLANYLDAKNSDIVFGNILYDDNSMIKSSLTSKILIKNTLHHQSAFYKSSFLKANPFSKQYRVLSDYEINLIAFLEKRKVLYVDTIIALCAKTGISKNVNFGLYKEELLIKQKHLNRAMFYLIVPLIVSKFVIKSLLVQK